MIAIHFMERWGGFSLITYAICMRHYPITHPVLWRGDAKVAATVGFILAVATIAVEWVIS